MCRHVLNCTVYMQAPCCKRWFECAECHDENTTGHRWTMSPTMRFTCRVCRKCFERDFKLFSRELLMHIIDFIINFLLHTLSLLFSLIHCVRIHTENDKKCDHCGTPWVKAGVTNESEIVNETKHILSHELRTQVDCNMNTFFHSV